MLHLLSTKNTPEVVLKSDGLIKIVGRSMNTNINDFAQPINEWVDSYICNPAEVTCVDIYLEYLNTTNYHFLVSLLKKIENLRLKNKKYLINWYYEDGDDDIFEKGEYISELLKVPFNFIMISGPNSEIQQAVS